MTHMTTRDALLTHYRATRARLGDRRTPPRPIIPRDRIAPGEPPATIEQETKGPEKLPPLKIKAGVDVYIIPPRQSTLILQGVAERHGVTVDDLKSSNRKTNFVIARQEAYYLLKQAGYSTVQCGRFLGGRDHTTIMHGILQHEKRIKAKGEQNGSDT